MSKDADKDVVESGGSQQVRRRRKKSGLRIPSDNVPRNTPSIPLPAAAAPDMHDSPGDYDRSDGIVTPIPEDPNVAVAVAYTFRSSTEADEPDEQEPGLDSPATSESSQEAAHERSATAPAAGGEMEEMDVAAGEELGDEDGVADEAGEHGAGDDDDDLDHRRTRRMPAVQLHELGLADDLDMGTGSGDIDIPIDEAEPVEAEPAPDAGRGRAATVALSDEDLEELIEPMEISASAKAALSRPTRREPNLDSRATQPVPIVDAEYARELAAHGEAISEQTGERGPAGEPAPEARVQAKPRRKAALPPEPGVPAAVAALEGAGMESPHDTPLAIGDAGDSGELLSDDLIEEVDDSDVEVEPASDVRAAPPPAPPVQSAPAKKPPPAPRSQAKPQSKSEPVPKPKRRKGKPWFEEIFDEDYLRTLPFLTPQATQAEAAFVASALEVEPGSQLLDVGCGYGRHAMELAARGYQVIALDLSLPLLLRGADEAQRRGLNINFVHGDMRELNFDAQFDGAYCLFSTFGYFDDEANKQTIQGISRSLRPGARLVLEVLNRDYLITDLPARVWWEGDGCVVLEEVDFNYFSSRIVSNRSVVFDDGRQLEQEISVRSYSLHEFGKLLHAADFRVIEISGSLATRGRFFGNKSREIIVVAEKRAPRDSRAATQGGAFPRSSTATDVG